MKTSMNEESMGLDYDSDLEYVSDEEVMNEGSDPKVPLPVFSQQAGVWPKIIQDIVDKGSTPAQRDVLLLGALTLLGATIGSKARVLYDGKYYSPCMMLFVVAPPASGKGKMSMLRHLAQPFHDELLWQWQRAMEEYKAKKLKFDSLGKEKRNIGVEDIPVPPTRRFFIIPGNNSGTGMQANIIDSNGRGIIMEVEADTLSAALNADYGHFDDALRKFFDHDGLTFFRRTENESKEAKETFVSVLLSGTPAQVGRLIPSAENGLFSRFMFYYMPPVRKWISQFGVKEDQAEWFRQLGVEWKRRWDGYKEVSSFTLELDKVQMEVFDGFMEAFFSRAMHAVGGEGMSLTIRLAHHLLRIMEVVALLRAMEAGPEAGMLRPAPDIPAENVKDGIVPRYVYGITIDDFMEVLSMGGVLFRHSLHILSLLPPVEVSNRGNADREMLFSQMAETFKRKDFLDKAGEMNINENTALKWLKRALAKGMLLKVGHGVYRFKG